MKFRNQGNHKYNLWSNSLALILDHIFRLKYSANNIYRVTRKEETIDSLLEGKNKKTWSRSLSNKWSRLSRGNNHDVKGIKTIDYIHKHQVPHENKVT